MEAISNAARSAAAAKDERYYAPSDLEQRVGVSLDSAYLVTPDDDDDYIMVVTGISHVRERLADGRWYRPRGMSEAEFEKGIQIEAAFYDIRSLKNGAFVTHDEPFKTPRLYKDALPSFPRKRLESSPRENTYALPSMF